MLSNNLPPRLDLVQHMIDRGKAFRTHREFTIPADGEIALAVDIADKVAVLYERTVETDQPDIRYEIYTGSNITSRTDKWNYKPANPMLPGTTDSKIHFCTYSGEPGDEDDVDIYPGQAASGTNRRGDIYTPTEIKPLPNNTTIMVLMKNPNGTPCKVLLKYKWFEVGANAWKQ